MSISKWDYEPEKCDGGYCPGDCDYCDKENETESFERSTDKSGLYSEVIK